MTGDTLFLTLIWHVYSLSQAQLTCTTLGWFSSTSIQQFFLKDASNNYYYRVTITFNVLFLLLLFLVIHKIISYWTTELWGLVWAGSNRLHPKNRKNDIIFLNTPSFIYIYIHTHTHTHTYTSVHKTKIVQKTKFIIFYTILTFRWVFSAVFTLFVITLIHVNYEWSFFLMKVRLWLKL